LTTETGDFTYKRS